MSKTLYVSDLDGTLLNSQGRISENSLTRINQLIDEGMHFTYATAQSRISSSKITQGLSAKIPVIVYNGAFIMEREEGKILHSAYFDKAVCGELEMLLIKYQIHPIVYAHVDGNEYLSWNENYTNEGMDFYLGERKGDPRLRPLSDDTNLFEGDQFYITCIGSQAELTSIYEAVKDLPGINYTFQKELYRPEYWLEIMPAKATKAQAIQELLKIWDCDKIISFGDAMNDLPMFAISDESYAVENAMPQVKEKATGIIASNDQDGVVNWLWEKHKSKD